MGRDASVIRGLRRRSPAALRTAYETHKDALLSLAVYLLRDVAAAEAVLHDVFVRLAARPPALRARSKLKAYWATCVANRARDVLRRRGREAAGDLLALLPSEAASPDARLVGEQEARRVRRSLLALPGEQRQVVAMHVYGEMTFKQIAAVVGASPNTIRSRYRYGLARLRAMLKTRDEP